jgi:gluconolactonase
VQLAPVVSGGRKNQVMALFAKQATTALIPFALDFISQLSLQSFTNMSFLNISLLDAAVNATYLSSLSSKIPSEPAISLHSYHPDFYNIIGQEAKARKLWDLPWEAFHEAGVYNRLDNSLYISSNYHSLQDNINITVVSLGSDDYPYYSTQLAQLAMANGGTTYYPPGADHKDTPPLQVYCDEGDFEHYSQLLAVDPNTNKSRPLLTSFMGRNFSSLNDVRQHPQTGDLWFTDADYGYFQHFRSEPTQPKQVYRFEPDTGIVQVVADGFVQPNGLEFSPDLGTLYISDTGSQQFQPVPTQPSTIYAFDIIGKKRLGNRRTFAYADTGFPDGVHCDTRGNVWASCGDGVHIWNPQGVLLGKIYVGETSNNFAFAPGKVFVFSNSRLWIVENIKAQGREVCRDFGVGCH